MNLEDEIDKKLRLSKPSTIAQFEAISDADDSSSTWSSSQSGRSCKIRYRNPHLYLQSDANHEQPCEYQGPNEYDITASIIEAHGGKTSTNQDEVEIWRAKVEINRLEQLAEKKKLKEAEEETLKKEADKTEVQKLIKNTEESKTSSLPVKKNRFKRNVLMRTLEQHLESEEIPASLVEPTSSGKNDINNHDNTPMLTQSLEDPDFYYLRDTSSMNFNQSDDFRFKHRGVKKTVTPRHYALHELSDECFKFRRN